MEDTNNLENPIKVASFESIDELFSKDPMFMTEEDLGAIVKKLREGRSRWLQSQALKARAPAKKKLTAEEADALLANLTLNF